MLSLVFSVICIFSCVWSICAGTAAETASALLDGAGRAVEVTLALMGMMSLWSGVMTVFREAGVINKLSHLMGPVIRLIFKKPSDEAVACLAANFLGIGNAATPLGISALQKMQEGDEVVTDDGIMLTALCCASFSPIPTTVLALRRASGAAMLFELLPAIWLVGILGTVVAIVTVKLLALIMPRGVRKNA